MKRLKCTSKVWLGRLGYVYAWKWEIITGMVYISVLLLAHTKKGRVGCILGGKCSILNKCDKEEIILLGNRSGWERKKSELDDC